MKEYENDQYDMRVRLNGRWRKKDLFPDHVSDLGAAKNGNQVGIKK